MNYQELLARGKTLAQGILDELNDISEEYIHTRSTHRRQEDFEEICIALALSEKKGLDVPEDLLSRKGRFKIYWKPLVLDKEKYLTQVMKFMEGMFVYRCEYIFGEWVFNYEACSPLFESLPEHTIATEYEIIFTEEGFEVKKKDDNSLQEG